MLLKEEKRLVLNIVNKNSIGWGIARAAKEHGAEVGVGAQNKRMMSGVHKLINKETRHTPFMIDFTIDKDYKK